jgi:Carboxypeptidase regulatory-like domain/TonB-dependent Receptor Plug Domain
MNRNEPAPKSLSRYDLLDFAFSSLRRVANRVLALVFLTSVFFLSGTSVLGQMNTAELSGVVNDPSGAMVANATIEAIEGNTQLRFTSESNTSGEFLIANLPVGTYKLKVNAKGFKQAVESDIAVHAGDKLRQTFHLELGDQSEVVTVSGTLTGLSQMESAAIKDTIEQRQVIDLPLKGRNFIDLVGLSPGVTNPPAGTRGSALQQTGNIFGILGQRSGHNLYLVDGVSVTDEAYNNMVLNPSLDDIQEVSINETSYDAEFGGKSGGVINVVTKFGNNGLHGSLFESVRNDIFDAKNFFIAPTASKPPFQQNQFGGSIGGPIQKNKAFFFANYEGVRTRMSQTQLFTIPTALERTGDFTGSGITVNVPGTTTPYPNDTIPTVDPVAAAVLAKIPLPTTAAASNNLNETAVLKTDANQYNARIDHTFNAKDSVFVRGSVFDVHGFSPFGSAALNESLFPAFGYNLRTHTDNLSATWNHVFDPSWINELRFGWMKVSGGEVSPNAGNDFAGQTGLQGVSTNPLDTGYPSVTVTGFSALGESTQYVSRQDSDYEIFDNVLWHHGTHTAKFGGYFFHLDFDPVNAQNARGTFAFTGKFTGNSLGDFLLGDPNQGSVGVQGRGNLSGRTNWAHFYIEDGWQITPSLKLDIGLRYEYNQAVTDANNNIAIINTLVPGGQFVIASNSKGEISPAASPLLSTIPIPFVTSTQAGWDSSLLQGRPLRLAPRIGLAWALPDHRTVIRSGFGIYTNQAAYNIIETAALNLPFYFAKTVTNTTFNTENVLASPANGSISGNNLNHDFKIEYNNVWNLTVQHSFSPRTSFQAEYIGSYTVHADNETYQNLFPNDGLDPASGLHFRPIPSMSGFPAVTWDGWEKYNALALTFTQRLWHGLTVNSVYTWSKAMDDASNPGADNAEPNFPQNPADLPAEAGLSDFDHRHRFVTNFLYEIPFLKGSQGWVSLLLSNWKVGGIWTLQSGAPLTVSLSTDVANNGEPLSVPSQRPNLTCNPNSGPKTATEWFKTSCFAMPVQYAYGDAGRNIVIGPGLDNVDTTLQKEFSLRENMSVQFRVDMFDLFNHPNFNPPIGAGRTFSSSTSFGAITSANDPRDLQFSLRLTF